MTNEINLTEIPELPTEATAPYATLTDPQKYSDSGAAILTAERYHPVLRHTEELGWLHYAQGVWSREQGEKLAQRSVETTLRQEAEAHIGAFGTDAGKKVYAFLHDAFNRIDRITHALARHEAVSGRTSDFDALDDDLNTVSGVVNLRESTVRPHSPQDYLTKQTPYSVDASTLAEILARLDEQPGDQQHAQTVWFDVCPRWMTFLHDVFLHDVELIDWLQVLFGYCLTGQTSDQIFPVFYGGGRNGKTTLLNVLNALLGNDPASAGRSVQRAGSYAASVIPEVFVRNTRAASQSTNSPTPELAKLEGVRLAWSEEPEGNDRGWELATATIKRLTGSSRVSARKLYKESFDFLPRFKAILAVNHRPKVSEDTDGFWRRLRLIPFKARFEGAKRIRDLDKLLLETEGEAILLFLLVGARRWYQEGGLKEYTDLPRAIQDGTEEYRERDRSYYGFFQHYLVHTGDGNDVVKQDEAFAAFREWRERHADEIREALRIDTPVNGHFQDMRPLPAVGAKKFGELVEEQGFLREKRRDGRYLIGAVLRSQDEGSQAEKGAETSGETEHGGGQHAACPFCHPSGGDGGGGDGGEKCAGCDEYDALNHNFLVESYRRTLPLRSENASHASQESAEEPTTYCCPLCDAPSLDPLTPDATTIYCAQHLPCRTVPVLEPSADPEWLQTLRHALAATTVCDHPAEQRVVDGGVNITWRSAYCRVCGQQVGEAQPDPTGCQHTDPADVQLSTANEPDEYGEYPTSVYCRACERGFVCVDPTQHRSQWDSLGCPRCSAAKRYREPEQAAQAADTFYRETQRKRRAVAWQTADTTVTALRRTAASRFHAPFRALGLPVPRYGGEWLSAARRLSEPLGVTLAEIAAWELRIWGKDLTDTSEAGREQRARLLALRLHACYQWRDAGLIVPCVNQWGEAAYVFRDDIWMAAQDFLQACDVEECVSHERMRVRDDEDAVNALILPTPTVSYVVAVERARAEWNTPRSLLEGPTEKQAVYLQRLGFPGDPFDLPRHLVSEKIDEYARVRDLTQFAEALLPAMYRALGSEPEADSEKAYRWRVGARGASAAHTS